MTLENFDEITRTVGDSEFSLSLNPFQLYESILIIKWDNSDSFNSAAMGIRFMDDYSAYISPYSATDTYKILHQSIANNDERKRFSVNFPDNVSLFARAALKGTNAGQKIEEIASDLLLIEEESDISLLADSRYVLLCELVGELKDFKLDASEILKEYNNSLTRKQYSARFEINILKRYKSKNNFQPFNRGDNLALEAITLASKLPVYANSKKHGDKTFDLLSRIRYYEKEIRRFSANKNALDACNIIDDFINKII